MAQAYGRKVIEFEEKSTMSGSAIPYGGGISLTEKQIAALDTDRIPPVFNIGMMDNNLPAAQIGNEPRFLGSESE
jgi:hypothetical protein